MTHSKCILPTLSMEPLAAEDIPAIVEIDLSSNPAAWSKGAFEQELKLSFSISLIAKEDNNPVAFLIAWHLVDTVQILQIAVAPTHRNKKVGTLLIEKIKTIAVERKAKRIELELRKDNIPALNLYQKRGFIIEGERKNFYGNQHAILMHYDIS